MGMSIICQPVNIFKHLSETIGPIELKFHIELFRVREQKFVNVLIMHIIFFPSSHKNYVALVTEIVKMLQKHMIWILG